MAAATINNNVERHVIGDLVVKFFNISGATGTTLMPNISRIFWVGVQQSTSAGVASAITSFSFSAAPDPRTITFNTGGGAMTNEQIMVIGRIG